MKLYTYFRSSAAYRVRIASALKGIEYQSVAGTVKGCSIASPLLIGGQSAGSGVRARDRRRSNLLTQCWRSSSIWTSATPEPPLFGSARWIAHASAASPRRHGIIIHPVNNPACSGTVGPPVSDEQKNAWYRHWVEAVWPPSRGMLLQASGAAACHGDTPTLADCCLVLQVHNARRFDCRAR